MISDPFVSVLLQTSDLRSSEIFTVLGFRDNPAYKRKHPLPVRDDDPSDIPLE
jgi:hypothetical protein